MIDEKTRKKIQADLETSWRACFTPRPKQTVSEWCEHNLILSERDSAFPGPLNLDRAPYLREIFDALQDDGTEEISLCAAAQVGKTLFVIGGTGYCVAQDPGPTLMVLPNSDLAQSFAENRLDPVFWDCPAINRQIPKDKTGNPDTDKYKKLEKLFGRATLRLVGSNSPANLASRPIRWLWMDEIDKFPLANKDEAGAIELAIERTKSFWNKKIVCTSTPTTVRGNIWRRFLQGDQRYFHVPCPFCQEMQTLRMQDDDGTYRVKWPDTLKDADGNWDTVKVREQAWYECVKCKRPIKDHHKSDMLVKGEWRAAAAQGRHRSYHLNSLYANWVKFGDVAAKFLTAQKHVGSLQDFLQGWLAQPWEEQTDTADDSTVLTKRCDYVRGECSKNPLAVVITADYGEQQIWYVVRAWCHEETSYLIQYGSVPDLHGLAEVAGKSWDSPNGKILAGHGFIDSGYETDAIYKFCNDNRWYPLKGQPGKPGGQAYWWNKLPSGQTLFNINVDFYKDALQVKLKIPNEHPGSWNLPKDTDQTFANHIAAEICVEQENKRGYPERKWKKRGPNHLLDCEVYQLAVAAALNLKHQTESMVPVPTPPPSPAPVKNADHPSQWSKYQQRESFIGGTRPDGRGHWDV